MRKKNLLIAVASAMIAISGCSNNEVQIDSWEDENVTQNASIIYNPTNDVNSSVTEGSEMMEGTETSVENNSEILN